MKLVHALLGLCCLVLVTSPALATEQDPGAPVRSMAVEAKEIITEQGLTDMMSVTMRLKEAGASYQKSLAYPAKARLGDDAEARRLLIGVYQFDALYAAAFGKKKDVSEFLKAQSDQVMKLNLKGRVDVAAVFPPELNWMLREPDKVDFDDIVTAYADNLPRYEELAKELPGLNVLSDALYGFVVEGLYVSGQSILDTGSDPRMKRVINALRPALEALTQLYASMEYAPDRDSLDPTELLSQGARRGWVKELTDLVVRKQGDLSDNELAAIAAYAVEQRKNIMPAD